MRERARQGPCERDIKPVRERAGREIKPVRESQGDKACESRQREPGRKIKPVRESQAGR